ncbi:MAG: siderophore-interacting protein, partial [Acidimicrobiales bacterium]
MRVRREPPRFREISVGRVERLTPRLVRVTLTGPELAGFVVDEPAASVRLLLPPPDDAALVMPAWNGNEFLLPDSRRATIRTFTPRRHDPDALELDLDIVVHDGGAASEWADAVEPGAAAAISGPGRGYTVDAQAPAILLAGDETALAAVGQLLESLPFGLPVHAHLEIARRNAQLALPEHPRAAVEWHVLPDEAPPGDTLVAAVEQAQL